jgi:hypothetical protein
MALSTEDTARLAALRTAYDQLLAGKMVAEIQRGDRTLKYAQADKAGLKAEIDRLEAEAAATGTVQRRGALRFRIC